jgi:CubicO group peptidase (beta-lactamase class C family)
MDLLAHRSGWPGSLGFDPGDREDALGLYVDEVSMTGPVAPPGKLFGYGQTDGILAGYLLEQVTGMPYETAIHELALSPLSMEHSYVTPAEERGRLAAAGHVHRNGEVTVAEPFGPTRVSAPVAGLSSNLNEVSQFVSFHASATTPPTFLDAQTRELMHRTHGQGGSAGPVRIDSMGLGWMISEFAGTRVSLLTGSGAGHSSLMVVAPDSKFGIIVLANAEFAQDLIIEIAYLALDLFRGLRASSVMMLERPDAELDALAGDYEIPGGPTWHVIRTGDGLRLQSPDKSLGAALAFVSPLTAKIATPDATLFVDFVLNSDGNVGWLRHMGQLAPRSPAV